MGLAMRRPSQAAARQAPSLCCVGSGARARPRWPSQRSTCRGPRGRWCLRRASRGRELAGPLHAELARGGRSRREPRERVGRQQRRARQASAASGGTTAQRGQQLTDVDGGLAADDLWRERIQLCRVHRRKVLLCEVRALRGWRGGLVRYLSRSHRIRGGGDGRHARSCADAARQRVLRSSAGRDSSGRKKLLTYLLTGVGQSEDHRVRKCGT